MLWIWNSELSYNHGNDLFDYRIEHAVCISMQSANKCSIIQQSEQTFK